MLNLAIAFTLGAILASAIAYALHLRHSRKRDEALANDIHEVRGFKEVKENVLQEISTQGYSLVEDNQLDLYIVSRYPVNVSGRVN